MRIILTFMALLLLPSINGAQSFFTGPDSLYNDDPDQRLPLGMTEAEYRYREAGAGKVEQSRIEPPFWWIGMNSSDLQLLLYDQNIKEYSVALQHPGVELLSVEKVRNANYLFINIRIGPGASPGSFPIVLSKGDDQRVYRYELKPRISDLRARQGVDASDLIYLIMPDRFANGDYSNDSYDTMNQQYIHRGKFRFRHGGDLIGIMQHLDYLEELGVTALWLNPVLENDQPYDSYHGYAITDHYQVDARFGTNEQYLQLVRMCHERGIKVIMDVIFNHVGDQHWFIKDLPSEDWIHQFREYLPTLYRATVWMDPYYAGDDRKRVADSWFDRHMPDLNQQNPLLANYLIQNSIWWTEYTGQDAFRIDTYAYCDQDFMAEWGRRMQEEFPGITFFAETWVHGIGVQAQFTEDNDLRNGYNSYLPAVTDYQLYYAMSEALAGRQGWTDGVTRIYYTLAQDFLYEDPYRNVIFLDNHDLARLFSRVDGDYEQFKSAIIMLMSLRGIPLLYYGTEILLAGAGGGFGEAGRVDFPGGWREDEANKFRKKGRTVEEQQAFEFVKKLAQYRKNTPALQKGKLTQFVPENGVYVYFRHDRNKTIMVLINSTSNPAEVPTVRYTERLLGFSRAKDILNDEWIYKLNTIKLGSYGARMLELGN